MPCYRLLALAKPNTAPTQLRDVFRDVAKLVYREQGVFRSIENLGVRPLATPMTVSGQRFTDARWVQCTMDLSPKGRSQLETRLRNASELLRWATYKSDTELAKFQAIRREKLKRFTPQMEQNMDKFDPSSL